MNSLMNATSNSTDYSIKKSGFCEGLHRSNLVIINRGYFGQTNQRIIKIKNISKIKLRHIENPNEVVDILHARMNEK